MNYSLEMALASSKRNFAVKESASESNLDKDHVNKVTVIKNPQHTDYFVYENSSLKGQHTVQDIGLKYGTSGWEVGK